MTIAETKKELLNYTDFFGGDISATDRIESAKTKSDLADILDGHEAFLEDQLADAKSHLLAFRKSVGLHLY